MAAAGGLTAAAQACAAVLLVFVFTDVGYAAPLNSFYSQSASLLFLLLDRRRRRPGVARGRAPGWLVPAFFLCAAGFVGSKPQESLFGPRWCCSPSGSLKRCEPGREAGARDRGRRPVRILALVSTGALPRPRSAAWPCIERCSTSSYGVSRSRGGPGGSRPGSRTGEPRGPERIRAGVSARRPRVPGAVRPGDDLRKAAAVLSAAAGAAPLTGSGVAAPEEVRLRPGALGNFEKTAPGYSPNRRSGRFAFWSGAREKLMPVAPVWLALLIGGNLAAAAAGWRRAGRDGRRAREAIARCRADPGAWSSSGSARWPIRSSPSQGTCHLSSSPRSTRCATSC